MRSNRFIWAATISAAAALASVAAVGGTAGPADAAASIQVRAASASEPVGAVGETFFTRDLYLNTTDANITLSGSADGRSPFYVDDILKLQITRPDGTVTAVSFDDSNGCTASTVLSTNPVSLRRYLAATPVVGHTTYKLHFTFSDACGGDDGNSPIYLSGDFSVAFTQTFLTPMDGGTFVDVHHLKPFQGITQCTTGFSVSRGGTRYMLLAKHCFDGGHPQNTNQFIAQAMPVTITTLDPPFNGTNDRYSFATELSCLAGPDACLLPPDPDGAAGDVVAFKPDVSVPSGKVQTANGLQPILGERTLAQLPKGQRICHYGYGSWSSFQHQAEQCGPSFGTSGGLGQVATQGAEGDSGGPVYVYAYGGSGQIVGVYALGTTVTAGQICTGFLHNNCTSVIQFIPIAATEAGLGAALI